MPDLGHATNEHCDLTHYGIQPDVVEALFKSVVDWLRGEDLPWTQTRYVNVFEGPQGRTVVELLFFHYDGPPEREIGGGGEFNHCKLYLYDDHVSVNFTGENSDTYCGLNFKYSTKWFESNKGLLGFIVSYLNEHLTKIFETDPTRFNGFDKDVESIKSVVAIADGVLQGHIVA